MEQQQKHDGKAIASLVLGIISCIFVFLTFMPSSVLS